MNLLQEAFMVIGVFATLRWIGRSFGHLMWPDESEPDVHASEIPVVVSER